MLIISGANYRFKFFAKKLKNQCEKLKYDYKIYDLGGLGFGENFQIDDYNFKTFGYYEVVNESTGWCSRALHKPELILKSNYQGTIAYMDADAMPVQRFDEIENYNYDIGITVRGPSETCLKLGRINAGVVFIKNTSKKEQFLEEWRRLTIELKNDQIALNRIVENNKKYNIKEFPASIYNYYYFPKNPSKKVKIYHFKSEKEIRYKFPFKKYI